MKIINLILNDDLRLLAIIAIVAIFFFLIIPSSKKQEKRGKGARKTKRKTAGGNYEYKVAKYLKRHGFYDIEVTKGSGDYGVDIVARKGIRDKYAIQCKRYSTPVGVSAVQEAVAGKAVYNCNKAMVITNSTYTKGAEKLASENRVILMAKVC